MEKFVTVGISVPNEVSDKSVGVSGVEDKDMRLHTQMTIHTQQETFPWTAFMLSSVLRTQRGRERPH